MKKEAIHTDKAPKAIGTYSQAIRAGYTVYLSGQIGLDPVNMALVDGIDAQIHQVFRNLSEVASASGGSFDNIAKLNIYMTDLSQFPRVNEIMAEYFRQPYPARATIGVAALPRNALIEMDAVMIVKEQ
jgi:reactive intermediate/imine deaminase